MDPDIDPDIEPDIDPDIEFGAGYCKPIHWTRILSLDPDIDPDIVKTFVLRKKRHIRDTEIFSSLFRITWSHFL